MNRSQAKEYLESMLKNTVPVDIFVVLECFRNHYRTNPVNGVDFKFILVSTAPRIDFHTQTEV